MTDTPLSKFNRDFSSVNDDRGKDYGHPADDFRRAQTMMAPTRACADPELRHCLEMICVKMARLIESPGHLDSWVDIAGYAKCAAMILDRRTAQLPTLNPSPSPVVGQKLAEGPLKDPYAAPMVEVRPVILPGEVDRDKPYGPPATESYEEYIKRRKAMGYE